MTAGPAATGAPPPLPAPPAPAGASLFLDFDGTLAELAPRPDAARLDGCAAAALARLVAALPGRVAVLSGRPLAELAALLGPALAPRLALAGSHGVEVAEVGAPLPEPAPPPALAAAAAELAAAARAHGLLFEPKPLGAALHYRERPAAGPAALAAAQAVAARHGLHLQAGHMVAEVRVAGDKGAALRRLLAAPARAGTVPVMVGDDVTDEAGFAAAAAAGGWGVLVGAARATAAAYALADVAAVAAWLDAVADRAGADRAGPERAGEAA